MRYLLVLMMVFLISMVSVTADDTVNAPKTKPPEFTLLYKTIPGSQIPNTLQNEIKTRRGPRYNQVSPDVWERTSNQRFMHGSLARLQGKPDRMTTATSTIKKDIDGNWMWATKTTTYELKDGKKERVVSQNLKVWQYDEEGRIVTTSVDEYENREPTFATVTEYGEDGSLSYKFYDTNNGGNYRIDSEGAIFLNDKRIDQPGQIKNPHVRNLIIDKLRESGNLLKHWKDPRTFLVILGTSIRGYDEMSGLSQIGALFNSDEWLSEHWQKQIDDFCAFGGLSKCFESYICKEFTPLTSTSLSMPGMLITPTTASAHIEGDRSTPINEGDETRYYYRVTFAIVNSNDQNRTWNVEFIGPDSTYKWWESDQDVGKGEAITYIRQNPLIRESTNLYDQVCLYWTPPIETYGEFRPRKTSRICNSLNVAKGVDRNAILPFQQQSQPQPLSDRQPGDGF